MTTEIGTDVSDPSIGEARDIAMDRYDLDQPGATALLARLARRHRVEVPVIAAAIVAAALARRRAERRRT